MVTPSTDDSPRASMQRHHELILRNAGVGLVSLDVRGAITFANPAAAAMLGFAPEALIGRDFHGTVQHTRPDGQPFAAEDSPIRATVERGEPRAASASILWRKDGTHFPAAYTATPMLDEMGRLLGAVVAFRDASEMRARELGLRNRVTAAKRFAERQGAENAYLRREVGGGEDVFERMVGSSDSLADAKARVEQAAPTDATVLILGETGVGKGLFARAIHELSDRRGRPLVKLNCAALPSAQIESELFGHEPGAFPGATERKPGRFEIADGGTIFLDEVGELPFELQTKLLRVLQEGELERVGGTKTIGVNVRVVAATNRNLSEMVRREQFRDDLFYRLNVYPIPIPPLRERLGDIPALVDHFVAEYTAKLGKRIDSLPDLDRLREYPWPGNVRELENVVERAMILATGGVLPLYEVLGMEPEASSAS